MKRAARWFLRILALLCFGLVWWVLPVLMPSPSRVLTWLHFVGLVAAFNIGCLLMLASLYRGHPRGPRSTLTSTTAADRVELLRAARAHADQAERGKPIHGR